MKSDLPEKMADTYKYTGFWLRTGASLIDTVIILALTYPILISIYGWGYLDSNDLSAGFADLLVSWVLPIIAVIVFWIYYQATPGKMLIKARIVDAKTGNEPTLKQYIIRYFGYFLAGLPLGLGIFWVAWDKRKQGWHDKLAGTVVISPKVTATQEVHFTGK
ncbi:putative membrane protein [Psychromonas sp. CNPT3]|uniref:RDD family protein n=1 Tax=Psychromonas sp. CNPT3 TaxID=314282 RepID=UPI00006E70DE|nr:RDD family protein [Psychromonas sp. CNPT3]AGH81454.1 putative membrane protein [Psychromonas sp. CNPT3]